MNDKMKREKKGSQSEERMREEDTNKFIRVEKNREKKRRKRPTNNRICCR
jgi:hypothetical protein